MSWPLPLEDLHFKVTAMRTSQGAVKHTDFVAESSAKTLRVGTADADFGQTDFGHPCWPTLAKPTMANFSVSVFWPSLSKKKEQQDEKKTKHGRTNTRKVGPRRVGGPKFRSCFPFPHPFSFFVSLWMSSRGILVVFEPPGALKCARLGSRAVV